MNVTFLYLRVNTALFGPIKKPTEFSSINIHLGKYYDKGSICPIVFPYITEIKKSIATNNLMKINQ